MSGAVLGPGEIISMKHCPALKQLSFYLGDVLHKSLQYRAVEALIELCCGHHGGREPCMSISTWRMKPGQGFEG